MVATFKVFGGVLTIHLYLRNQLQKTSFFIQCLATAYIYLLNVSNGNFRATFEIYSKLAVKIAERRPVVFITNFKQI